jgi:leucyl-tRNA synthetase
MGPLEEGVEWETSGVAGTRRFLDRAWRLITDKDGNVSSKVVDEEVDDKDVERVLHAAIKKVTEGVEQLRFNTAIADMMVFVNEATKADKLSREWLNAFLRVLCPFAPHVAEEMWQRLGNTGSLAYAEWPVYDEAKLAVDTITLAVQVMGKLRGTVEVSADIAKDDAIAAAKADPKVAKFLEGKTIRREIYVPGKLVNLVAN